MERLTSVLRRFLPQIAVVVSVFLAIYFSNADVARWISVHPWVTTFGLLAMAGGIFALDWYLLVEAPAKLPAASAPVGVPPEPSLFIDSVSSVCARFLLPDDYDRLRNVALTYFPENTLLNPRDYVPTMGASRRLVRGLETVDGTGGRTLEGYYALWPMNAETFADLCSGALPEAALGREHILRIEDPAATVLYISDVCVLRGSRFGRRLMTDLRRYIAAIVTYESKFEFVAGAAFSADGQKIAGLYEAESAASITMGGKQCDVFKLGRDSVLELMGRDRGLLESVPAKLTDWDEQRCLQLET